MIVRHIFIVGAMFASAHAASAASITVNQGVASVSIGQGFSPVASGSQVPAGAKVIVSQGGSASINYGPACVLNVSSGQVATVPDDSACVAAAPFPTNTLLIGGAVVAGGVGAAIALSGDDKKTISP